MAVSKTAFLTSPSVSVSTGNTTVTLTGGANAYHVYYGTVVFIGESLPVEGISGTTANHLGVSTLELRNPWPYPNVVGESLIAFNTNEGLPESIRRARSIGDLLLAILRSHEELLTSTDPTIEVEISGVPTEFVPYGYLVETFGQPDGQIAMTLSEALASENLEVGQTIRITDRADGLFDVVLVDAGGDNEVIPNELNIVQSIEQPLLALNLRVNNKIAIGAEFGIVADIDVYYDAGWVLSGGTDQSTKINTITRDLGFKTLVLPIGWIRCNGQIAITSGVNLRGSEYEQGFGGQTSVLVFAGNPTDDFIIEDATIFEVSHYSLKGVRVWDGRDQLSTPPTSGYGIKVNKAVNSQIIEECFFDSFPDGPIFVGADTNSRSADNIVINKVWASCAISPAISLGNMNNNCTISNIYSDGPYPVIKRLNGNQNTCVYDFSSIKHETGPSIDAQTTISTWDEDNVFCHSIIRRSDNDVAVISPPSKRGSYLNIRSTSIDGTRNRSPFEDLEGNIIEGSVNNYIPNMGALKEIKNYIGAELVYFQDFGAISKKITGMTSVDHPNGEVLGATNTKLVELYMPADSVFLSVDIQLSVDTGSTFAGKIDLLYAGDIRGAGTAFISGRLDSDGSIVDGEISTVGSGKAYDNVTIQLYPSGSAGVLRLLFQNTGQTYSTFLKGLVTIACQPGHGQMIG